MNTNACHGDKCEFKHNVTRAHLLEHIKNHVPTRITHDQIDLLPARSDFLDCSIEAVVFRQVTYIEPILFLPTSIISKNDYSGGIAKYKVYMFGILPCGSKTCVVLENIDVYFDIAIPGGIPGSMLDNDFMILLKDKKKELHL